MFGALLRTTRWTVERCVGPLGVSTLLVKPLRHVTGMHEQPEPGEVEAFCGRVREALTSGAVAEA